MKHCTITRRDYGPHSTIGVLRLTDGPITLFTCVTCELPWAMNRRGISCVPAGTYVCTMYASPTHGLVPLLNDVPGRSLCEIHPANFSRQLRGCIAPGLTSADIDKDGTMDVTSSREAFRRFMEALGGDDRFTLTIEGNGHDKLG